MRPPVSGRHPWLSSIVKRYRRRIIIALALGLVAGGCSALLMFDSGYLISATAQPWTTLFSIMVPVAFVQLFGFGRPLARYLERLVSHDWVLKLTSDLRRVLFESMLARRTASDADASSGEYLQALANDIAHLQNLYLRSVFPTAVAYLLALGAAIAFGLFSPGFALVMMGIFALTCLVAPLVARSLRKRSAQSERTALSREYDSLVDDTFGALDLVLAGRGGEAQVRHARAFGALETWRMRSRLADRALATLNALILGAAACLVLAWAAHTFDPGTDSARFIAAFTLGLLPLVESFVMLPAAFSHAEEQSRSLDSLGEILDAPEIPQSGNSSGARGETGLAIRLSGVSHAYGQGSPTAQIPENGQETHVLTSIDLEIPSGQRIAILGPSGSGKTTLANLVRGIARPTSGEVRVCGVRPADDVAATSQLVGYLPQDPFIFARSLRDNLLLDGQSADDAQLEDVLCKVGLAGKLASLPNGLDTMVGEGGFGFSGGEAHRVSLARVLVRNCPIIMLDEPFAALDPQTESSLIRTLFEATRGKTLVVITHHLALIERFDRVVFMNAGHIELDGSPAQLESSSPYYRSLLAFDRGWLQ